MQMPAKRSLSGTEVPSVRSIDLFAILKFMHDNKITDDVDSKTIANIEKLSMKLVSNAALVNPPIIVDAVRYRVPMINFFKQFKVRI
jgi:hypothetical protein